jgi:hypothetical protein
LSHRSGEDESDEGQISRQSADEIPGFVMEKHVKQNVIQRDLEEEKSEGGFSDSEEQKYADERKREKD